MRHLSDIILHQSPLTLPATATVRDACEQMARYNVGSVLVTDGSGGLVGIFTGRDAVGRVLAKGMDGSKTRLVEVMTPNPETMSPDQTALEALRLMWDGGFRHVPMVRAGKIVGVVSRGDFKGIEHEHHQRERELWEHLR
jgi:CBS domain-containing protein